LASPPAAGLTLPPGPTAQILGLFPEGFSPDLAKLVSKVIVALMPEFHAAAIGAQPSLPRLQSVDWRVDVKSSSNAMQRMAEPTVIVNMQVEGEVTSVKTMAPTKNVTFELDEPSLNTMLEGLGKIREQLSNVAS